MAGLTLAVCPHDTARNIEGWHRLARYLSRHLGRQVRFGLSPDFADFHRRAAEADLAYASPVDALRLIDRHGFTPLARPVGIYDEALIIASPDAPAVAIEALGGAPLATVEGLPATKLALRMLGARGLTPGPLVGRDSWLSVARAVWGGEAPYGILYRDAYEELSPQGKAMVQVIGTTDERCAFHALCGAPWLGPDAEAVSSALVAMASDGAGKEVLEELRLVGWRAVSADEVAVMRAALG